MKKFICLALFLTLNYANGLDYNIIKKGQSDNNTVLIIGGIQGDEPGGFMAANLIAMDYEITKGSVWIVPNLNFYSIIKRNRGPHGDMNRKFAELSENDPDFNTIQSIKKVITEDEVSLILHLHDGSGFYREKYINKLENPSRWGNCLIIDQEKVEGVKYGDLEGIAKQVMSKMNLNLIEPKHKYHLRNTNTAKGDQEMLKALTYFAITNGKAAFANEASKELPTHKRAYYHLLAIEEYLKIAGVEFKRNFELSPNGVKKAIDKEIDISLFEDKFYLNLKNPRNKIGYVPMPKTSDIQYSTNNNLAAVYTDKNITRVYYGNRVLTRLNPEYFEYSDNLKNVKIDIDGQTKEINLGSKIKANSSIKIHSQKNVRVNVIGFNTNKKSEDDVKITKKDIHRSYSIDKEGKVFRVEFYEIQNGKKDKYLGMFLVEFAFAKDLKKALA